MKKKSTMVYDGSVKDYARLLKPRVMSLVVFSALVGLFVGRATAYFYDKTITMPDFLQGLVIAFIAMGAGSAGALNMWIDRDIDSKMRRTMNRPLPQGKMPASEALAFGLVFALFAVLLLSFVSNYWAGGILAITIFYYAVVYSIFLKKRHVYNVVIGGVAGALPPVIGYTAVFPEFHWQAGLLFLVILLWTPPHSWALAIFAGKDYQRANIKMLPNEKGFIITARHIFFYSFLLLLSVVLFFMSGITSFIFNIFIAVLTMGFFLLAVQFLLVAHNNEATIHHAKKFFGYSIFYLFVFLLGLLFDLWL